MVKVRIKKFLCLLLYFTSFVNFIQAAEENVWISNCFQAAQYEKNGNFKKAAEEYTKAIESMRPDRISNYLNLYIERGLIYTCEGYLVPENYEKAIQDFSFVINYPQVSKENHVSALAERAQAYLLSGKRDLFIKDIQDLEELDPNIISYEENENYVIFKMGNRVRSNTKVEKSLIRMLIGRHSIHSEEDVILTSSGIGMIKKSKSSEAPKGPFFE
jgi:tetratricopeptide (TPR) repeat protein